MNNPSDQGFTLVEVLAALAVFSLAAIGLIQVTGQSVRTAEALEASFGARVVASNVLVDTLNEPGSLTLGTGTGREEQLGRSYTWTRQIVPAPIAGADTVRITVTVSEADGAQQLADATSLRRRQP